MRIVLAIIATLGCVFFGVGQTFTDVAASQGISYYSLAQNTFVANGMSFYDFDEDGWDDLTFPATNDSILFYRNVNGTYQQVNSYVHAIGYVRQITWVDYDNDLDLDLAVSYDDAGFRLYQNDGSFNFTDITTSAGISNAPFKAFGFSFADPDADGDLDLYLCSFEISPSFTNPEPNRYYQNQGNGTFVEMAQLLGIDNGAQTTFMSVWFDYNNDDLIDLHLINDRVNYSDALYQNHGNDVYMEIGQSAGISNDDHDPMSLSVADFDNDGFQDVFKTDVGTNTIINGYPLLPKLYKNQGGVAFNEVASVFGLDTAVFGWGALWVDYDNDCYEDLYVATSENFSGTGYESLLYHNNAGQSFTLNNDSILASTLIGSFCPVKGDINNDGFYDIVVHNDNAMPNVLLNSGNANNYVKIDVEGTISNQKGIGAKIEVFANGEHQTQTVFCGSGLCAQNSQHKIFGIGTATLVDSVFVTFPSGIKAIRFNLPANTNYVISEQITEVVDLNQGVDTVYACPGDVYVIGQTGLYNYQWSNGSQDSLLTVQTTGTYQFEATNLLGDTLFASNVVHYEFEQELIIQDIVSSPPCGLPNEGAIELQITPVQIVDLITWSNGYSGYVNDNLSSGVYAYLIWTDHGCHYSGNYTLEDEPVFTTQVLTTPQTDTDDGTASFFMWQGVAPYQFEMNQVPQSNPILGLTAGTYEVVITDANGCVDTVEFIIEDNTTASLTNISEESVFNLHYNEHGLYVYGGKDEIVSLQVVNVLGQQIPVHDEYGCSEDNCRVFDVRLEAGIYYVSIETNKGLHSTSLFVPSSYR